MYRMFPRSVPSLTVFLAAAIFWLATFGPPRILAQSSVLDSVDPTILSVDATVLGSNFVVGEDGTTQIVPTNDSINRSIEEIFFDINAKRAPPVNFRREAPKPFSRTAWITNVLTEKLANFRPKSKTNAECNRQSELYEQNLKNLTLWAVQMRDASAKSVSGLLYGQTAQMGNYDECLRVQSPSVTSRFCLAKIEFSPTYRLHPDYYSDLLHGLVPPAESNAWEYIKSSREPARLRRNKLEWAVCVPSACTWKDVEESLGEALAGVQREHNIFINVTLNEKLCSSNADLADVPSSATLFSRLLLLLTIISLGVTIYHHCLIETDPFYQGGFGWKVMMGFSMVKNFRSLTRTSEEMQNLNGVDGIKFLSMVLIIYGHRLMFSLGGVISNPQSVEKEYLGPSITTISTQLVDTFFVVSGFLAFWLMYPVFKKNGAKIIPVTLFYRWLRVMPMYMAVIAFAVFLFPYIEEGPVWKTLVFREVERCQENWWTNLLVINNYVNTEKMCTVHGWYLACDLQFFVLGVFIIYALAKNTITGLKILLFALLISHVLPFVDTYLNDYDGILRTYIRLLADPVSDHHYRDFYTKGHNRAGPYLLGILTAYLVTVLRDHKIKFPLLMRWITILSIAVISEGTQCYGWTYFWNTDQRASLLERSFYAAFHRSIWALLPCGILIIHLGWGFGSSIEYILKHDFYVPMSRLTFAAFLVHPFVQLYSTASERSPAYFTHLRMAWMAAGDIFSSYVLAFWLYCIIEGPAGNLSSMLKNAILHPKKTVYNKETVVQTTGDKLDETNSNGSLKIANGDYKSPEISKIIPKDTVCFGMEASQKIDSEKRTDLAGKEPVKENGSLNNNCFQNYKLKPEESESSESVSDRPKELSDELESTLTPS